MIRLFIPIGRLCRLVNHTHVYGHVVTQIFIVRNEGIAMDVFKADSFGASIETVEIFHSSHNGFRCIVLVYLNPHG